MGTELIIKAEKTASLRENSLLHSKAYQQTSDKIKD